MVLPVGYQLLHLAQVDSTNEQAARMAADGVSQPHWIIADEQTAGRGRRGRHWVSPKGNLMTTLYLPIDGKMDDAGNLSFVAGLALAETVSQLVGSHKVTLKWPNDVLVDGAKISGILLETASGGGAANWLAIGMGLNLLAHPEDTPYPATSIKALTGQAPAPLDVLTVLAAAFDRLLITQRDFGFTAILTQWRGWAQNIGGPITVRLENETLQGIFQDIDETGALLLQLENGQRAVVAAGDVFFPDLMDSDD